MVVSESKNLPSGSSGRIATIGNEKDLLTKMVALKKE
jgi:hypothetical protein